jgi:hypothetical protein
MRLTNIIYEIQNEGKQQWSSSHIDQLRISICLHQTLTLINRPL